MDIKEIDSSVLNIEIIISLLDGKIKSAYIIASELGKYRMEDKYRIKCNHLASNGLLFKHPIKNRKGYTYSLNFDIFLEYAEVPKSITKEKIIELVVNNKLTWLKEEEKIKKGDFKIFLSSLMLDLLNKYHKERMERYEEIRQKFEYMQKNINLLDKAIKKKNK